ncbi:hypothetical protein ACF08A_25775 [Streptomyces cellulosae]
MTTPATRPIPTPAVLAAAPRTAPAYDRHRWEHALLGASYLHRNARLLGLVLAHHAGTSGQLPAGGIQHAGRLADEAGMSPKSTRVSLYHLETAGFIKRPDLATWQPKDVVRPVTLTVPNPAQAAAAAATIGAPSALTGRHGG